MPSTDGRPLAASSPPDLALVRAIRAWGGILDGSNRPEDLPTASKFSEPFRERLMKAWSATARTTPEAARQTLLLEHRASSRFDPKRVHPSWFVRVLEAESPAVRSLVADQAPEPIRAAIRGRFAAAIPSGEAPRPARPANPEVAAFALALWSERLVGDVAERPDDPPVILALSRSSSRELVRLVRALGQAKHAFAIEGKGPSNEDEALARTVAGDRVRLGYFRRIIGRADPRLIRIARGDFEAAPPDRRRKYAALGLITVARLLKAVDARRARWAIQHLPYPVAKRVGAIGGGGSAASAGLPLRAIRAWEAWIFEAAWARLLSEGRLGTGGEGGRP